MKLAPLLTPAGNWPYPCPTNVVGWPKWTVPGKLFGSTLGKFAPIVCATPDPPNPGLAFVAPPGTNKKYK